MMAGRPIKYTVNLTGAMKNTCTSALNSDPCKTIAQRCRILLGLNNCEPGKLNYKQVAYAHNVNKDCPTAVAKNFNEKGMEGVLTIQRNPNSDVARLKVDSVHESRIVAIACTHPPYPFHRWTVRLCCKAYNEWRKEQGLPGVVSEATVWRALDKNHLKPHLSEYWCIPELTPQFVMRMERVLHLYSLPLDPAYPIICADETVQQLLRDADTRLPGQPGNSQKVPHTYDRDGTRNIFLNLEPKTGKYCIHVTQSHTAYDWAYEIKNLVDCLYAEAKKIILVTDNLNTHVIQSLYKAFPPDEARRLASRIQIYYTPKNGSWLDMAEIGIGCMKRECIGDRFRTKKETQELENRLREWQGIKNEESKPIKWNFTVQKAREEHPSLYKLDSAPNPTSEKYTQWNIRANQDDCTLPAVSPSLTASAYTEDENIIDLYRSVDENGNVYWSVSLEEKKVRLHEPTGKGSIAKCVGQRNTSDGWLIPLPSKPRPPKKEGKEPREVSYDFDFMALGEDVAELYSREYDEKHPVLCVQKRAYDLENPSKNAWVCNLKGEARPKRIRKVKKEESSTSAASQEENTNGQQAGAGPENESSSAIQGGNVEVQQTEASPEDKSSTAIQEGDVQTEGDPKVKSSAGDQKDAAQQPPESIEPADARLGYTLMYEPHTGRKHFMINDYADNLSWPEFVHDIVNNKYKDAETISLVLCEEDAEKIDSLILLYPAEEALRISLKLDIHVVPSSARWLNFAENEAIVLGRRFVKDEVSSVEQLTEHLVSWKNERSHVEAKIDLNGFRRGFSRVYKPFGDKSMDNSNQDIKNKNIDQGDLHLDPIKPDG